MKIIYLILAVIGYAVPNWYAVKVSIETGNILFWTKPSETSAALLGSDTVLAFSADLFLAVFAFFIWTYFETRRLKMKNVWVYWALAALFGLAGTLPLFLYKRESCLN